MIIIFFFFIFLVGFKHGFIFIYFTKHISHKKLCKSDFEVLNINKCNHHLNIGTIRVIHLEKSNS